MKSFSKITFINLAVLLGYSILVRLISGDPRHEGGLGIAFISSLFIITQMIANFARSLDNYRHGEKQLAGVYALNIFIVLLVGFGVCSVNSNMF